MAKRAGRKADDSMHSGKNLRIRFIHEFVIDEKGDQSAMLKFVNDKLKKMNLSSIEKSTLQSDIQYLNSGDYLSKEQKKEFKAINGKYFQAKLNKKTSCYFYEGANIPPLNHLSEEEQMTLPFLTSLLDPYQEVPAFTKFLKEVSTLFDQDLQKIDTLHAFSISGPKFSLPEKRARMVTNMLILLKHIHRREIIKFKYYTSTSFNSKRDESEKPKLFKLKPICVRLYQGLYYLTGVTDNKKQQLLNFRIDNIVQDSIMTEWVSKDVFKVKTFELNATLVEVDFNNKLSRALGIWIHDENSKEEKITIRFYSWAAKYALLFNLHPTQKLICLDEKEEYADFEFCLYTSDAHIAKVNAITKKYLVDVKQGKSNADNRPYIEWMNKFPEAGYLFGRFINFIELL